MSKKSKSTNLDLLAEQAWDEFLTQSRKTVSYKFSSALEKSLFITGFKAGYRAKIEREAKAI